MSKFEIEKNIPLPKGRQSVKYPFNSMEPGDSFLAGHKDAHNARAAAHSYAKHSGLKFKTKKEEKGVRIWRIE